MDKTKDLFKDTTDNMVEVHEAGMNYRTITDKQLGEQETSGQLLENERNSR